MAKRDPETDPRAFLGRELRQARIAAGFSSQDALAARLDFDRTVIAKAETGDRVPTDDVLDAWCDACTVDPERRDLLHRWAAFARRTDGPIPSWFEGWLEAERVAHMLRIWQPLVIPGLLQTAGYARALFIAAGADQDRADDLVTVRLDRQAILDRPDPPHVVAVIGEPVLHALIGSAPIMADQLAHVADMAERPNISVQVLPSDSGANAGLSGAFDLASADGAPEVLRMEAVEDVTTESRSLLRQATNIFVRVQADALPRMASLALIREAAEQWKSR
ncbi:MAG TPA: helix-turn-helix transcriptional regulator [Streptosporangiaceae bacterium]|nr:helix-turn-helix transcriptional regulator [Streptosporangiaceae bacterium]